MSAGPTDNVTEGGVMLEEPGIVMVRENVTARACW